MLIHKRMIRMLDSYFLHRYLIEKKFLPTKNKHRTLLLSLEWCKHTQLRKEIDRYVTTAQTNRAL
jgi:hypothetical protein